MSDFKPGDHVRYVPNHAHGDAAHPDCEDGVVSRLREDTPDGVFVRYLRHGRLLEHAQLTDRAELIPWDHDDPVPPARSNKAYLGDSVYADLENGMVKLTTENGGEYASNTIYLEPTVIDALLRYLKEKNVIHIRPPA